MNQDPNGMAYRLSIKRFVHVFPFFSFMTGNSDLCVRVRGKCNGRLPPKAFEISELLWAFPEAAVKNCTCEKNL